MHLACVRIVGLGPFRNLSLPLVSEEDGSPRLSIVLFGSGGTGKTTILNAIANTRPGYVVIQNRYRVLRSTYTLTSWRLGQDEPSRPHWLRMVSPNAILDESEESALQHRREQALYDKRASEGGFVLLFFPSTRWFSRAPMLLTTPERTIARYDVRASTNPEDASRNDLARETKQALAYAIIAASLCHLDTSEPSRERLLEFDQAMRHVVSTLIRLTGYSFRGIDPVSLEPSFSDSTGRLVLFDDLPNATRHLIAFGALSLRAVFAAYSNIPPLDAEAVVLIDELELHQEISVVRQLIPTLRQALPRVQWIFTTSSSALASSCETGDLFSLRRTPPEQAVELFEGIHAITH